MLELVQSYSVVFALSAFGCTSVLFGTALGVASVKFKSELPSIFLKAAISLVAAGFISILFMVLLRPA